MQAVMNLPEGSTTRLGGGRISDLALSPDGCYLVVGSSIGVWWYELPTMVPIALWDTERGMISAISFSPDGQWLATGDGDGILKMWDVQKGICVAKMDREDAEKDYHSISQIAFSPDSQLLAASSKRDYILYVWHWKTGVRVAKFHEETNFRWFGGSRRPVVFSKDGCLLACTMPNKKLLGCAEADGSIRTPAHSTNFIVVWNIKTSERLACLMASANFTESLSFSPCGQFLAAGERGGAVRVWAVNSWELLDSTILNDEAYRMQVSYSPESTLYAMGTSNSTVTMWDVELREKCYTSIETSRSIECTYLANGSQLIFGTEREFKIWEPKKSQQRPSIHLHTGIPDSLAFSGDGKTLAGGYWNKGIMLWEIENPAKYPTCFNPSGGNYSVSGSPTGKIYVIGHDTNTTTVWEIDNTEIPITNFTLPNEERRVTGAAFAPTSKMLACGDDEGMLYLWNTQCEKKLNTLTTHVSTIRLWSVANGRKIATFRGHPTDVQCLAFSSDGTHLASGSFDGTILLWDLTPYL